MMKTAIHFRRFLKADEAVSAIEYAVLVGVMITAVAGAIAVFGGDITTAITTLGSSLESGATSAATPDLDG